MIITIIKLITIIEISTTRTAVDGIDQEVNKILMLGSLSPTAAALKHKLENLPEKSRRRFFQCLRKVLCSQILLAGGYQTNFIASSMSSMRLIRDTISALQHNQFEHEGIV